MSETVIRLFWGAIAVMTALALVGIWMNAIRDRRYRKSCEENLRQYRAGRWPRAVDDDQDEVA